MNLVFMYLDEMLPWTFASFFIYIIIRAICIRKNTIDIKWAKEIWMCIFVVYMVSLLSQTIIPSFSFYRDDLSGRYLFRIYTENSNASVNLIPFHTISEFLFTSNGNVDSWGSFSVLNIMANMFFFMPFGFLLPILWEKCRSLKVVFILGFIFTFLVEFIQYFIGRSSDIDDIILNVISIVIGYGIYHITYKKIIKVKG